MEFSYQKKIIEPMVSENLNSAYLINKNFDCFLFNKENAKFKKLKSPLDYKSLTNFIKNNEKKLRTNKKLINLLRHETPKQRQKFLNEVDNVLCEVFGLEYKDLPWRNLNACDKDWDKYVGDLRLAISKTLVEFNKRNRVLH